MTRSIDFDDEATLETHEVDDVYAQDDLPLKLRTLAPPVANSPPNEILSLDRVSALFACEATHERAGDFVLHRLTISCRARAVNG